MRNVLGIAAFALSFWLTLSSNGFAAPAKSEVSVQAGLVDLNLASRKQLMTLPGIGENEAVKIIEGRPYYAKTELMKKGIVSAETFYGIVEKITIDWEAYGKAKKAEAEKSFRSMLGAGGKKVKTRSGLVYQDIVKGSGKAAAVGKVVKVHYTGWLKDGTKFDSSRDRGEPITFVLGKGEVIRGWDEGIQSMKVGGKRILTIPAKLGYGEKGAGNTIPPNATLIFEVELDSVLE